MSSSPSNNASPGRRIGRGMILAAWVLLLGLLTLFFSDLLDRQRNPNRNPASEQLADGIRQVVLQRNRQGHYVATGRINGVAVEFLLDTGATDVAIPQALAERLGLQRTGSALSRTANGVIAVWTTRLASVTLGDIALHDVRASVLPGQSPDDQVVLLGMSFLKRLEFTQRDGELLLLQRGGG